MKGRSRFDYRHRTFPQVPKEFIERFKYVLQHYDRFALSEPDEAAVSSSAVLTGEVKKEVKASVLDPEKVCAVRK